MRVSLSSIGGDSCSVSLSVGDTEDEKGAQGSAEDEKNGLLDYARVGGDLGM